MSKKIEKQALTLSRKAVAALSAARTACNAAGDKGAEYLQATTTAGAKVAAYLACFDKAHVDAAAKRLYVDITGGVSEAELPPAVQRSLWAARAGVKKYRDANGIKVSGGRANSGKAAAAARKAKRDKAQPVAKAAGKKNGAVVVPLKAAGLIATAKTVQAALQDAEGLDYDVPKMIAAFKVVQEIAEAGLPKQS